MKKLRGWIQIFLSTVLLLIFLMGLIAITLNVLDGHFDVKELGTDLLTLVIGSVIIMLFLVIMLKNGIEKVKKERKIKLVDYNKTLNISLTGKIEFKNYRNLILKQIFDKFKSSLTIGLILLFLLLFMYRKMIKNLQMTHYFIIFFIGIVLLLFPFNIINHIKKEYNTNTAFKEELNYLLTNDSIQIKGNTLNSTQKWTHFCQKKETKSFFLFYYSKKNALLLEKRLFSKNDLIEFKKFFRSLNLKNT